jgi:signal transduction histidine kinase
MDEDARQRYASIIQRNATVLGRLIDDILDLSKIEAGKVAIERTEFSLSQLLSEILSTFELSAQQKQILLRFESVGKLPERVISDPLRIRQVLINLIGNAVKFTDGGHVVVEVAAKMMPRFVRSKPDISRQGYWHWNNTRNSRTIIYAFCPRG